MGWFQRWRMKRTVVKLGPDERAIIILVTRDGYTMSRDQLQALKTQTECFDDRVSFLVLDSIEPRMVIKGLDKQKGG